MNQPEPTATMFLTFCSVCKSLGRDPMQCGTHGVGHGSISELPAPEPWPYVTCECGTRVEGCNDGDVVNNLRIHFAEECGKD